MTGQELKQALLDGNSVTFKEYEKVDTSKGYVDFLGAL